MKTTEAFQGEVLCSTGLSRVRGNEGRLICAGYEIEDLAAHATFEDVCHLLWEGSLPDREAAGRLRRKLIADARVDDRVIALTRSLAPTAHPIAVLRTAISVAGCIDSATDDGSEAAERRKAIRLTAQAIALSAAIARIRASQPVVPPHPELGLAANFLFMVHGREADPAAARALDVAFVLHAEHGLNASTLAARLAAAAMGDMHSAVVAAVATLGGPLHGGAGEGVLRMLEEIGTPERAAEWIRSALDRGNRIMGFGHRTYTTVDPRAPILEALIRSLDRGKVEARLLDVATRVREVMEVEMAARGRRVYVNVDFYSAPMYAALGIPTELFGNVFACARLAGLTAHIMEQHAHNRLSWPEAAYTGPEGLEVGEPQDAAAEVRGPSER